MAFNLRFAGAALVATLLVPPGGVVAQETDFISYGVSFEQFEYRTGLDGSGNVLAWDGDAFVGNDEWKVRLISEGEFATEDDVFEVLEHQFVVQRLATDFFDVKAGVRYDAPDGPDRWFAVIGLHGLAQQWFEVDADLFLNEKGGVSGRLDIDYELLLTNYWTLTPSAEIDLSASDDRAVGVGAGLVSTEVGLRLSYDLVDRAVSPYVGVHYERKFGQTKNFARDAGEGADAVFAVAGVRILF